ncbi:hypothetical protein DM860_006563 [Cuscuta australis]|uniref:Calcium uniporter protein C-terminal domain-containing protein n=1 Tax=Cuscuta australis TaxID=267555 RepID=A0A328D910_9ASTE|nr:hypothetical protein DM860_006563 [Cuscuta australis]
MCLAKRIFNFKQAESPAPIKRAPLSGENDLPSRSSFHRQLITPPRGTIGAIFQRFFHRRAINAATWLPKFVTAPAGDESRKNMRPLNIPGGRIGLAPPPRMRDPEEAAVHQISVNDMRKILRSAQLEKVRSRIRGVAVNCVPYAEFVTICGCGCNNREQALEFAKMMDESGTVIVLGDVVLLRPDLVAKSMEKMIYERIVLPNDPRRKELETMEKQKGFIDQKAQSLVKRELYCGLGFLALQTLGFMRLTFWELSWDVMEPICFFVTSFHFGLAYTFFLRTSKEPSFEGYFRRRFKTKQEKLMKLYNFDVEKYNKLREAFFHVDYDL